MNNALHHRLFSWALAFCCLLAVPSLLQAQTKCLPTPPDIEGPFYRSGAPVRDVLGQGTLTIYGYVLSTDCEPIPGALIDVWQADPEGQYDLDSPDYNYRGKVFADEKGFFVFYTDLPGLYPQRPIRHIHYRASADGYLLLTTQQYFDRDFSESEAPFDFVLIAK